jgi:hypothetical protein
MKYAIDHSLESVIRYMAPVTSIDNELLALENLKLRKEEQNGSTNFGASCPYNAARSLHAFQRGGERSELWECMRAKP